MSNALRLCCGLLVGLVSAAENISAQAADAAGEATLTVHAQEVVPYSIPRNLTGKFCEHLGANIYNGMDAQILRNPTFAEFPFWTGQMTPDGITSFQFEQEKIESELRRQALRAGWPEPDIAELLRSRSDGLACFWSRSGKDDQVQVSPDTGPHGGRAQRLELRSGGGIKQWTWLPLHRIRRYEIEVLARSPNLTRLALAIFAKDSAQPCVKTEIAGLGPDWRKLKGSLAVPDGAAADEPYSVNLSAGSDGQVVIGHVFLRPADHENGADPDVVRMLRESHLPLLRWPGGNFVSAYHWEDGIGLVENRPTKPNYAWGGVEPNTFGTDEFIAFCRTVGCEPMICVNAGTGTPEEAARWIEYCNGPVSSPMGARRAANGHPEPYRVRHWEVGNELWGRWQAHWTTAAGYVDRYRQFSAAMLKADPAIELHACGAPVMWGKNWNDTLIARAADRLHSITDHPLIGGDTPRATDPLDVYRDFMHVPDILERKWSELREDMSRAGIQNPRLAVTELQMFAHLGRAAGAGGPERLTHENLVNPGSLGEAVYDTLIYHAAVRLQPFVEMVTHSATVNHGGGLRKERERVYANPCHYANMMFSEFAEARPVKSELQVASERAPLVLPDIRNDAGDRSFPLVGALAALTKENDLLVSAVNRGTAGDIKLTIHLDGFRAEKAELVVLTATEPWAVNSLAHPESVHPVRAEATVRENACTLVLPRCSVVKARLVHN